jgi:hypothetical protein
MCCVYDGLEPSNHCSALLSHTRIPSQLHWHVELRVNAMYQTHDWVINTPASYVGGTGFKSQPRRATPRF